MLIVEWHAENGAVSGALQRHWPLLMLAGLLLLGCFCDISGADLWVADQLYAWQGGAWRLRQHLITEQVLHEGARYLVVLSALVVFGLVVSSHWVPSLKPWQRSLWYLLACLVTTPALVAMGKSFTHMDCPWDLQRYGGQFPYLHLFDRHSGAWKYGHCFPGGHSSGGFAWVALYFFFAQHKPSWRSRGLLVGVLVGLVFGLAQQLRGAHFMSHDWWSLAIAWAVAMAYQQVFCLQCRATSVGSRTTPET